METIMGPAMDDFKRKHRGEIKRIKRLIEASNIRRIQWQLYIFTDGWKLIDRYDAINTVTGSTLTRDMCERVRCVEKWKQMMIDDTHTAINKLVLATIFDTGYTLYTCTYSAFPSADPRKCIPLIDGKYVNGVFSAYEKDDYILNSMRLRLKHAEYQNDSKLFFDEETDGYTWLLVAFVRHTVGITNTPHSIPYLYLSDYDPKYNYPLIQVIRKLYGRRISTKYHTYQSVVWLVAGDSRVLRHPSVSSIKINYPDNDNRQIALKRGEILSDEEAATLANCLCALASKK